MRAVIRERLAGHGGNAAWNSAVRMPWPVSYFGLKAEPIHSRTSLALFADCEVDTGRRISAGERRTKRTIREEPSAPT